MRKFMCFFTMFIFVVVCLMTVTTILPSTSNNDVAINNSSCNKNNEAIKKIVSIVYDDSRSMSLDNKKDYTYASYSLQNLMSLLNSNDEVGLVKMSSSSQVTPYSLSSDSVRQNTINNISEWKTVNGTPFKAVDTAVDWLKNKKNSNGDSQLVEYWLIVLTDGMFETGQPASMTSYLSDLKNDMRGTKFEGVLVAIGKDVPDSFKNDWNSVLGNVYSPSSENDIVNTMSSVSTLIKGIGNNKSDVDIKQNGDSSISFSIKYPARKIIIFEQNQSVNVKSINAGNSNFKVQSQFTGKLPKSDVTSKTIHLAASDNIFAASGNITINFDGKINTSEDNLKVLIEYGLNVNLEISKVNGKDYDKNSTSFYVGDTIQFKASLVDASNCNMISIDKSSNDIKSYLYFNDEQSEMTYKDGAYYSEVTLSNDMNSAYTIMEMPGYFKTKSDVLDVNQVQTVNGVTTSVENSDLSVKYKYTDEYENVGTINYCSNMNLGNQNLNLTFNNLPDGLKVQVNGVESDSNKVSANINTSGCTSINILRNKDFNTKSDTIVTIDANSPKYNFVYDKKAEFKISPEKRNLSIDVEDILNKKLTVKNFDNTPIVRVTPKQDGEYLSKEEMEENKLSFTDYPSVDFDTKVVEVDDHYAYEVDLDKSGFAFRAPVGESNVDVKLDSKYGETAENSFKMNLKDDITKWLPILLLILLLLMIIGYLPGVKHRFNKRNYFIRHKHGNEAPEDEQISVDRMSQILPYIPEKGSAGGIEFKATNDKNKINVLVPQGTDLDDIQVDKDDPIFSKNKKSFNLFADSDLTIKEDRVTDKYTYLSETYDEF